MFISKAKAVKPITLKLKVQNVGLLSTCPVGPYWNICRAASGLRALIFETPSSQHEAEDLPLARVTLIGLPENVSFLLWRCISWGEPCYLVICWLVFLCLRQWGYCIFSRVLWLFVDSQHIFLPCINIDMNKFELFYLTIHWHIRQKKHYRWVLFVNSHVYFNKPSPFFCAN